TDPDTHVIVLTACEDAPTVLGMLRAGVKGYIVKEDDPETLVEAIRVVMRGKTWLSPTMAEVVTGSLVEDGPKGEGPLLTVRELEVLQLLGKGHSTDQIGEILFISKRTVHFHIERTLEKLHVHNRMEAFAIAVKNAWIQS
ncbi:MAG: response regulator transcription factor, partial [Anaerolineaceae bacterium]|nr:response regulator transcription factor [Anaerolineaceae bacterium]